MIHAYQLLSYYFDVSLSTIHYYYYHNLIPIYITIILTICCSLSISRHSQQFDVGRVHVCVKDVFVDFSFVMTLCNWLIIYVFDLADI